MRDAESTLASLCDWINTFAREHGVQEVKDYLDLEDMRRGIDRVVFASRDRAARLASLSQGGEREVAKVGCEDCGRAYGSGGFPDLIITKEAWERISTTKDDGGLLCPSCICQRLHDAKMSQVEGAFMSGPIKSVDPSLMHTIRWVENLRVQGHGWTCPDCNAGRAYAAAEKGESDA